MERERETGSSTCREGKKGEKGDEMEGGRNPATVISRSHFKMQNQKKEKKRCWFFYTQRNEGREESEKRDEIGEREERKRKLHVGYSDIQLLVGDARRKMDFENEGAFVLVEAPSASYSTHTFFSVSN